jgi:Rps23 Pro-64 3,4-dihydroxylase Tpa1-like proline 4-hydroxylase
MQQTVEPSGASPDPAPGASNIFPYARWLSRAPELAAQFESSDPYPYVVLEEFLEPAVAEACVREFPRRDDATWNNYVHVNERKHAKSDQRTFPPTIQAVTHELNSERFLGFVQAISGISGLIADDAFMGGGLHQSGKGGFLNIHADFTGHPHHPRWRRRINLLVYLNPDWEESYGGQLELWDRQMTRCVQRIAPRMNRAVIFQTDADAFHGHPEPMTCPDDFSRRSLALYYFTKERAAFDVRSTEYRARPGDGARAAAIYLDKMVLRGYDKVKRTFGLSDDFASRLLGVLSRRKK